MCYTSRRGVEGTANERKSGRSYNSLYSNDVKAEVWLQQVILVYASANLRLISVAECTLETCEMYAESNKG
jgi:hypothetical protein